MSGRPCPYVALIRHLPVLAGATRRHTVPLLCEPHQLSPWSGYGSPIRTLNAAQRGLSWLQSLLRVVSSELQGR